MMPQQTIEMTMVPTRGGQEQSPEALFKAKDAPPFSNVTVLPSGPSLDISSRLGPPGIGEPQRNRLPQKFVERNLSKFVQRTSLPGELSKDSSGKLAGDPKYGFLPGGPSLDIASRRDPPGIGITQQSRLAQSSWNETFKVCPTNKFAGRTFERFFRQTCRRSNKWLPVGRTLA